MKRRDFLIGCGASATLLSSSKWRILGAPIQNILANNSDANHTFVLLFLRGGCDGLNFLAPYSDSDYQDARPNQLKIKASQGHRFDKEYMNTGFVFHPAARELKELYDNKDLAIIHACGLTNGTRSHFDAMHLIENGLSKKTAVIEGWMARYLKAVNSGSLIPGVSANGSLAAALMGYNKSASIQNLADYNLLEGIEVPELLRQMYLNDSIMGNAAMQTLETIHYLKTNLTDSQRRDLEREATNYPTEWYAQELSQSLKTVAQLIKMDAGVKMVNVDYGGWDTHENQEDVFPNLVKGLSQSVAAFYKDLGDKKDNVTVLVMSEFGRRVRANKSGGTDHGHGNFMMAIGGKVKGGEMYGNWPGLAPKSLDNRVDLAVTTDYRNVYANILKKVMQFSNTDLIFPDFNSYSDIGFL